MMKFSRHKTTLTSLAALSTFIPMTACDLANNFTKIDRTTNSEMQDFRDALSPREVDVKANEASVVSSTGGIPDLEPYVAESSKSLKSYPLVSISINQSIPLREALFELSKQANMDVELDPRISGSVIFTARNKPFDEVIDRICEISGLRYKFDDNTIRIEIDTPYTKNYKIDYLSFVRNNTSTIKTDVSVASSGQTTAGGGSTFSVDSKAESNFWAELDVNLKQILESNAAGSYLKTAADPEIQLTTANPNLPPAPPIDAATLSETAPQAGYEDYVSTPMSIPQTVSTTDQALAVTAQNSGTTSTTVMPTATPPSDSSLSPAPVAAAQSSVSAPSTTMVATPTIAEPIPVTAQPAPAAQQPVLRVESLPSSASGTTSGSGNSSGGNQVEFKPAYSINKQAGIVSVYANERLHKKIQSYLSDLQAATTSQVLIEAKVLEVSLSDEFSTGINWDLLKGFGDLEFTSTFNRPTLTSGEGGGNSFRVGFSGSNISSFVSALSRFGTVHALASPRLTVLNNQAAVLNVAKNQVYFELDVSSDTTPSSTGGNPTTSVDVDSTIKTVPEGVLINVMPSIDVSKRMVSMQVRPTVTKITTYVEDPAVAFVVANSPNIPAGSISSRIPVVNVQEVDSVVNMKDKQMMVMGGLLQDSTASTQNGVPVASEVPVVGGLFRNQGDKVTKTELVIFIKATILDNPSDSVHQTDREIYRMFGQDRRPDSL